MGSSFYREEARFSLSGKWGIAVLVSFLAALLGGLATGNSGGNSNIDAEQMQQLPEIVRTYLLFAMSIAGILGFARLILGGAVQLGYCRFLLNLHDGREVAVKDLFSQFDRFGEGLCLNLLRGIFTALWTLLFIIPGIVAAYSYSMSGFIMLENPSMGAMEALRASKEMMRGHKMELFLLELSFIGWALLAVLTLGIGSLWLVPYQNAAVAAFYRGISGSGRPVAQSIVE